MDLITEILGTQCIGDTRPIINENFNNLESAIVTLSSALQPLLGSGSEDGPVSGILKGDGTGTIRAATPGVDYYVPGAILDADLYVTGDVVAYYSSDERLKTNINVIPNALDKVLTLQGVQYEWNTELQNVYSGIDVGVLAQEVEKVLPTAVVDRENGYKAVKYERIIPLLIEAIKGLKVEIEDLKSKIG